MNWGKVRQVVGLLRLFWNELWLGFNERGLKGEGQTCKTCCKLNESINEIIMKWVGVKLAKLE